MADKAVSPDDAAAWLKGIVVKNHDDREWLLEFFRREYPECLDPQRGNERTQALIARFYNDANFRIPGRTRADVRALLESFVRPNDGGSLPSKIQDQLRDLGCIQALPLRLLGVMWGRRSASQGDLVPYVWGDQPSQSALKSAVHKVNDALLKIQHDRTLSLAGGEISWKT